MDGIVADVPSSSPRKCLSRLDWRLSPADCSRGEEPWPFLLLVWRCCSSPSLTSERPKNPIPTQSHGWLVWFLSGRASVVPGWLSPRSSTPLRPHKLAVSHTVGKPKPVWVNLDEFVALGLGISGEPTCCQNGCYTCYVLAANLPREFFSGESCGDFDWWGYLKKIDTKKVLLYVVSYCTCFWLGNYWAKFSVIGLSFGVYA